MTAISMAERAHHRHLVGQLAEHGKMTAESNTWERGLHLAEHRPIFGRRRHLRIEGLDVGGATLQVQHDDRLVSQDVVDLALGCPSLEGEQIGQGKSA